MAKKQVSKWAKPVKSPLVNYPGTVQFPEHFTMPVFRSWKTANDELLEIEETSDRYAWRRGDDGGLSIIDPLQWRHVLALAVLNIDNLPVEALTDKTGESVPLEVLHWLVPLTLDEYLTEKLNLKN